MLTPSENVVKLFNNEKCKGCKYALWIYVKPFYYWTADGVKHRENKAAVCRKYAKIIREICSRDYSICGGDCNGNN